MADTSSSIASSLQVAIDRYTLISPTVCEVESTINASDGRVWISEGDNRNLHIIFARLGTPLPLSSINDLTENTFRIEEMVDIVGSGTASSVLLDTSSGAPITNDTAIISRQTNELFDNVTGGMSLTGTVSGLLLTTGVASISSVSLTFTPRSSSTGPVKIYIPIAGTALGGTIDGILVGTISNTSVFTLSTTESRITITGATGNGAFTAPLIQKFPASAMRIEFDSSGTYLASTIKAQLQFPTPLYGPLLFANLDTYSSANDVIILTPEFGTNGIASATGGIVGNLVCEILGLHRISTRSLRADICIMTSSVGGFTLPSKDASTPLMYLMPSPSSTTGNVTSFRFLKACYINFVNNNPLNENDTTDDVTQGSVLHNASSTNTGTEIELMSDDANPSTKLVGGFTSNYGTINFTNVVSMANPNVQKFRTIRFICEISWTNATSSRVLATASLNKTTINESTIVK